MGTFTIFIIAWVVVALLMFVMWAIQYRTQNAGIVDVAWSFITPLAGTWLILADDVANGTRQYIIILLSLYWGFRLGIYLYRRVMNEVEDGRYRYMREYCGKHAQAVMFIFFQMQATWTILFALPFWAASRNTTTGMVLTDYIGIAIWFIAIAGETTSDNQLARFKAMVKDRSRVCNVGLWRYSRHPNYFFEWLQWWAFVCLGYGSDYWWLTWTGLAVMYIFITRITGIPYTEQQSLRSKGEAYREYQKTTSSFFPCPPRPVKTTGVVTGS